MWCDTSAPYNCGGTTYICDKTLDYKGFHFEAHVCYNFNNSWFGDMIIYETSNEEIPIELFRKHFHPNHLCHHLEDLRNCQNCKHRYLLACCTIHKHCHNKVKEEWKEHCEDWKWEGDK